MNNNYENSILTVPFYNLICTQCAKQAIDKTSKIQKKNWPLCTLKTTLKIDSQLMKA
jgi:hypothetical protein